MWWLYLLTIISSAICTWWFDRKFEELGCEGCLAYPLAMLVTFLLGLLWNLSHSWISTILGELCVGFGSCIPAMMRCIGEKCTIDYESNHETISPISRLGTTCRIPKYSSYYPFEIHKPNYYWKTCQRKW